MTESKSRSLDPCRARALLIAVVIGAVTLTGCTSTMSPTNTSSSQDGGLAGGGEGGGDQDGGEQGGGGASDTPDSITPSAGSSSSGPSSSGPSSSGSSNSAPTVGPSATPSTTATPDPTTSVAPETTATQPTIPATYTPPVDAEPVKGDCPYLTADQAKLDMSQRTGPVSTRPAQPQPVCEFVRSDGNFLATIRVLQFGTDAEAVAAVDYYLPRDTTNPEDRPAGWEGGSLVQEHIVTYGVSKGTWAVIAVANGDQTVRARLLVTDTITNLAL